MTTRVDRAALVRRAVVDLVAENGIHGTSMSQVANRAGVATGTAYVHYSSKTELLIAAFAEIKAELAARVSAGLDVTGGPGETFATTWRRVYDFLRDDPARARFLTQIDDSPLRAQAHDALPDDDPLIALAAAMSSHLVDLPLEIVYELGLAPAVRLAAAGIVIDDDQIRQVTEACWRAIGRVTDR